MTEHVTSSAHASAAAVQRVPTFVVAGAARAGSTAVVEALRQHPQVFVTQPKEPHFFALAGRPAAFQGPGDDETINRVAVTDEDAYRALYPERTEDLHALGEGSVSTLYYHEESVPRLLAFNPDVRVLVVLREPVARAYSSYQYLQVRGLETEPDFLTAVADEPRRIAEGWHHLWHYEAMSRYADALDHFSRVFGDRLGVWFYDDFEADSRATADQMLSFIGVDPGLAPRDDVQRVNVSGRPRRAVLQDAMAWAGRRAWLRESVKRVVPFSVRERIRSANLAPNGVPDEYASVLAPRFRDDLDRVEQVLGRPVPAGWRYTGD